MDYSVILDKAKMAVQCLFADVGLSTLSPAECNMCWACIAMRYGVLVGTLSLVWALVSPFLAVVLGLGWFIAAVLTGSSPLIPTALTDTARTVVAKFWPK